MLIKSADSKTGAWKLLERFKHYPNITEPQQKAIEKEIRLLKAGIKGEEEAAYLIDFHFKGSKNNAVIHDLRLEINDRVAQIDHLLINRSLMVFVLETKHFNCGIKINENAEFLRWNDFKKTFEGMPSPVAQNERHIMVLSDAFNLLDMPVRLGIRLKPAFVPYVLVSASSRIDRPKHLDTSQIIKADVLEHTIMQKFDKLGVMDTLGAAARMVSTETLEAIARQLVALHKPITVDYQAKLGLSDQQAAGQAPQSDASVCRKCGSANIGIQYGRFGYYFKCFDCDGNTPLKAACDKDGCKARIRKDGNDFYRECVACNGSTLFFTNL